MTPVYGKGPASDPGPEALIEAGVNFLLDFRDAALANLDPSAELTLEFTFADDSGFQWTCEAALRRDQTDVHGHHRWTVREVHPRLHTATGSRP
jgi:hypothetical protein